MALLEGLEIYIPQEAEVRRVPLRSLPSSLLRKMGLPVELPDPSDCLWICPALFQKKGQKETSQDQGRARQHMLTVLGDSLGKCSSSAKGSTHWKMSFVTANTTAYKVLKETLPVDPHAQPCSSDRVPQGPLSNSEQDAVIIHHGRIYLSMKRKRSQRSLSAASVPRLAMAPRPAADQGTDHSQMVPAIHNLLKRKLDTPLDTTEVPEPKLSDCGPQKACNSLGASPKVSPIQGANRGASRSQGSSQQASQSHGPIPTSSGARSNPIQGNDQSKGATVGAIQGASVGASRDQEPQEESSDQSTSQAPYMHQSTPQSSALSWGSPEPPALPDWGLPELSARQQDFDFQELETRERISRIEARLQKNNSLKP